MSHLLTLGLPFDADVEEIKAAYRSKVKACHPDRFPDDTNKREEFHRITEAYQALLLDRGVSRDSPDMPQTSDQEQARPVFKTIGLTVAQLKNGASITLNEASKTCHHCHGTGSLKSPVPIDCLDCMGRGYFEKNSGLIRLKIECVACGGTTKTIWYPCDHCGGQGNTGEGDGVIDIPAETLPDTDIRLPGRGRRAGKPCDLIVKLVLEDRRYRVRDVDIETRMLFHISDLVIGEAFSIPSPAGTPIQLKIPAGTQPGASIEFPDLGFQTADASGAFRVFLGMKPLDAANPEVRKLLAQLKRY